MTARILVLGRSGQVARALALAESPFEIVCVGRDGLDLSAADPDVGALLDRTRPMAAINAAAFTAVDQAEAEPKAAARLNRDAPALVGRACAARGVPLAHFSTDYVFDGEKGEPYAETDARDPVNAYGRSKAEGEAALQALAGEGLRVAILRVAWVFSLGGGGFLDAMLRAAARDEVQVVADQWGSPTPASACADAALLLAKALADRAPEAEGIFHAAGRDGLARADFAEAIFSRLPHRPKLRRVASYAFPTLARRPRDTRLSSARLERRFGWRAPDLEAALDACLMPLAVER